MSRSSRSPHTQAGTNGVTDGNVILAGSTSARTVTQPGSSPSMEMR